jgi:Xaa-Pro dipeptidase
VKRAFKMIKGLDAIVIQNAMHVDASFFYFTGIQEGIFENATVILRPPDKLELVSYILERESAKGGDYKLTLHRTRDGFPLVEKGMKGCKRVGINANVLPVAKMMRLEKAFPKTEFVDISKELNNIRLVKDRKEISQMRKAARASSRVADEIPGMLYEGMTETDLAAEISRELLRKGAGTLSFFTIVCFGANSAVAHHFPDETKLKKGNFIICDFGGSVGKYTSDITRSYVFGKATSKQKRIYKAVQKAQKVAFRAMKHGANGKDVHRKVDNSINRSGFKGKFTHATGHALGIDVHDCGVAIHSEIDMPMRSGMVFTVEPGIYLPGYGGVRIEDDVVVRKNGIDILTDANREMVEVYRKR